MELGWSHADVQNMPHDEYERWRAFMKWRSVQQKHAADVARARAR